MDAKELAEVLERAQSWPEEDQERLIELAREIEADRSGVYVMTPEEEEAVNRGLAQADRGEFATDEEVAAVWKKLGLA